VISLSREDTKAGRLQRACLAKIREKEGQGTLPTNATFVFYELEQRSPSIISTPPATSAPARRDRMSVTR
jgi:hypothetical protein